MSEKKAQSLEEKLKTISDESEKKPTSKRGFFSISAGGSSRDRKDVGH